VQSDPPATGQETLDEQQQHWVKSFARRPEMFGAEPSNPARKALELFQGGRIQYWGYRWFWVLDGSRSKDSIKNYFSNGGIK
jgi:hypothetical protein